MKTKLEMAHDYAMLHMMNTQYKDVDDLEMVQWAFDYADAMQAEADKREKEKQGQQNQKTYDAKCSKCNTVSKFSRLDGSIHRNEINREFLCVPCPVCQSDVWVGL